MNYAHYDFEGFLQNNCTFIFQPFSHLHGGSSSQIPQVCAAWCELLGGGAVYQEPSLHSGKPEKITHSDVRPGSSGQHTDQLFLQLLVSPLGQRVC